MERVTQFKITQSQSKECWVLVNEYDIVNVKNAKIIN